MLRYHNKPPRRPKPKPAAKPSKRRQPRFHFGREYGALALLVIALVTIRLGIALAGPAGIAAVGDRLVFGGATVPTASRDLRITAREVADPFAPATDSCSLDVAAMSDPGGAMTVMAVRPDGVMVSWAGSATDAKADCRRPGEPILVSENDYESLLKTQFPKH